MKNLVLALVLLPACCGLLHAQTFSLATDREPVASLDGLWRFHPGDNPAWASPAYDDSQWPLLHSDKDWAQQGYKGYSGFAWYRFRVVIPPGLDQVSLLLPPITTSYQVYVDGKLIGSFSQMPPHQLARIPMQAEYALNMGNASTPREATVALRVWHWSGWSAYHGGGPQNGGALVGKSSLIDARLQHLNDSQLLASGGWYSIGILTAISGTIALLLFLVRRKETEYLWFALNQLADAITFGLSAYATVHAIPLFSRDWAFNLLSFLATLSFVFFLQTLLRGRRSALFYAAIAAVSASPIQFLLLQLGFWPSIGSFNLTQAAFSLVVFAWLCNLLIRAASEGLPDARLLLAPVLISSGLVSAREGLWGAFQIGWLKTYYQPFVLFKYPFLFAVDDLVMVLFLIAMLAILTNRFMRSRSQEERFASEVMAARSVQQYLIPVHLPKTPGLAIESEYRPAREVGGDFFQVLPQAADGSVLIVVGDVAGHGLEAGMIATLIVGAIRTAAAFTTNTPRILALLNERMQGRGLATCLALRIEKDGNATLANAGHLPPYLNGNELPIEGALPLGAVPGIDFPVLHFKLAEGDSLMLMTDGVAEAQNAEGHLFGFERIAELLQKGTAGAALANAALAFGQEDDITVLTVARMAAAVSV
jgi:hypothetical protein